MPGGSTVSVVAVVLTEVMREALFVAGLVVWWLLTVQFDLVDSLLGRPDLNSAYMTSQQELQRQAVTIGAAVAASKEGENEREAGEARGAHAVEQKAAAASAFAAAASGPAAEDPVQRHPHLSKKAERVGPQPAEPPLVAAQGLPPHVPPPPPPPPMAPEPAPSADALCASAELVQLQAGNSAPALERPSTRGDGPSRGNGGGILRRRAATLGRHMSNSIGRKSSRKNDSTPADDTSSEETEMGNGDKTLYASLSQKGPLKARLNFKKRIEARIERYGQQLLPDVAQSIGVEAAAAALAAAVPSGIRDAGVRAVDRLEALMRRWAVFVGGVLVLGRVLLWHW